MNQDENNDAGRREAYRRNIPLRLKNNWQLLKSRYNDRDRRITNAIQMKGGEALESAGGMMRHQAANLVNYGVRGLFNGSADLLGLGAKGLGGLYKTSERVENKIAEHLPGKAGDVVRNQKQKALALRQRLWNNYRNSEPGQTLSHLKAGYNDVFDEAVDLLTPEENSTYRKALTKLKQDTSPLVRYGSTAYHSVGANAPAAALMALSLKAGSRPLLKTSSKGLRLIGKNFPANGFYNTAVNKAVAPIMNTGRLGLSVAKQHPFFGHRFINPVLNGTINNSPFLGLVGSHSIKATQTPVEALKQTSPTSLARNLGGFMGYWSRSRNLLKAASRVMPGYTNALNNMVADQVVAPGLTTAIQDPAIHTHLNNIVRKANTLNPKNFLETVTTIKGHPVYSRVAKHFGNYSANTLNPNLSYKNNKRRALSFPRIFNRTASNPELYKAVKQYIDQSATKDAFMEGVNNLTNDYLPSIKAIPPAISDAAYQNTRDYIRDVFQGNKNPLDTLASIREQGGIPTVLKNGVVGLGKELATPEGQAKAKQFLENTIQQSTDFTPEQKAQLVQYLNRSQEWPEKANALWNSERMQNLRPWLPYAYRAPAALQKTLKHFSNYQQKQP